MLAALAALLFLIALILDIADVAGDLTTTLMLAGLCALAAHFALGMAAIRRSGPR